METRQSGELVRHCQYNPYSSKEDSSHQRSPHKDQIYTERVNNPNDLEEEAATKYSERAYNFGKTAPIGPTAVN